jgi:3',5'-cyclic AMP phosphodiesterase CpdA
VLTWATDIHLDHAEPSARAAFYAELRRRGRPVVLTGDLADATSFERLLLELAAAVDLPVHFVLGNHDFYGGSIAEVRAKASELSARDRRLGWLPAEALVRLADDTVLVGHDGWSDGGFGDWWGSKVVLNDYLLIRELAEARLDKRELLARLQQLSAEAAAYLADVLARALATARQVIVATHVPPFREACWHEGAISSDEWLPHFSSRLAGEAILAAADAHRDRELLVLCGHTHGHGETRPRPNLRVLTGGAAYGKPWPQE